MAFIQATNRLNGAPIQISAEHIVSVATEGDGSQVTVAVGSSHGAHFYFVQEPMIDIVTRVEVALAYRRGR